MRIIIIGGGEVGYSLAKALSAQHDIFVIDANAARGERFTLLDVEFLHGSGTNPEVLRRAAVEHTDVLIAATRLDEVNIVACSIASQLGARETICFVTREDFLRPPGGVESLRQHFGIGQVIWPEAQLADAIERIIMAPGAIDAGVFAGGRIQLLEFRLDPRSALVDQTVSSLDLPHGVVIVAVKHEDSISIPRGSTQLGSGDKVVFMGTADGMDDVRGRILPDLQTQSAQLVTIIGGGDVGYRLAQRLDQAPGIRLRVIERDRTRGELLAATLDNALILQGDGTDLELLEAEEIGRSDVLVSVIDNDERNLLACLIGRQLGVGKVITRVGKSSHFRLFERVGIDVALSAQGAAVTSVVHGVDGGRASLLAVLEGGQARVVELVVPGEYPATALKDLGLPTDSIVGTVLRGSDVMVPGGTDDVLGGDRLLVCCKDSAVHQVRDLFATP
jgi:trk system potassium uptake protein TrkA